MALNTDVSQARTPGGIYPNFIFEPHHEKTSVLQTKKQISCVTQLINAFVSSTKIVQSLYFINPNFWPLAIFCGCTALFVSGLVETGFLMMRLKCFKMNKGYVNTARITNSTYSNKYLSFTHTLSTTYIIVGRDDVHRYARQRHHIRTGSNPTSNIKYCKLKHNANFYESNGENKNIILEYKVLRKMGKLNN